MKACILFTSDNEVAEDWLGKFNSREPLDIYGQKYLIDEISTDYEPGFSGATIKMYPVYQVKSQERPKKQEAWDGVGLPPVGTVCEYKKKDSNYRQGFVSVSVLFYGREKCLLLHSASNNEFVEDISSVEFRPIKTAEQLVEEEKKKVIDDMQRIYEESMLDYSSRLGHASRPAIKALYEAGYRKQ